MIIPSTTQLLAFFNLFAGIMLVTSLVLFIGGFIVYLVRLGTWPTYREEAVQVMMWGLSTLFTLVLILGAQQYLLSHLKVAVTIGAAIIILVIIWLFAKALSAEAPKPPAREQR